MENKLTKEQVKQIKKDFEFINRNNMVSRTASDSPSNKILLAWRYPYNGGLNDMPDFVTRGIFEKILAGIEVVDEIEYLESLGVTEFCLCLINVPEHLFIFKGWTLYDNFFEWVQGSQFTFDPKKYGLSK